MRKPGFKIKSAVIILIMAIIPAVPAVADEMLSLYGLKGYAYTCSPLLADGFHFQTGGMYSIFHERNLDDRDGYIWVLPASVTYGDGKWWEIAAASHLEYWKNTDYQVDESGLGDLFLGGKFGWVDPNGNSVLDISLMPYLLIPTGDRDKSIGDLYRYHPGSDDDLSAGANLLLGKRLGRVYLTANIGVNYLDGDEECMNDTSLFFGLAAEYQIGEALNTYAEFINSGNKLDIDCCDSCYDPDSGDDIREIGAGLVWLKNKWGFKFHLGYGLTETSPDFRAAALINRTFSF